MRKILVACLVAMLPILVNGQTITSFAGKNIHSFFNATPATLAQLKNADNICVSPAGDIYIADRENNSIRKVSASGVTSRIGGNGIQGFSGDGGPATAAQINKPDGIAVDGSGNVYFSQPSEFRIRKITPAGIISTFAGIGTSGSGGDGGPATAAQFGTVSQLLADTGGNIYVSDHYYGTVRKISTTGIITRFAGTGATGFGGDGGPATAAQFSAPWGMAMDASGNFYIADCQNSRIRKVTPSGIINTIAGTGTYSYSGDGGPATAATLAYATGVSVDTAGNVFIVDGDNYVVRKINTSGIISTVAGTAGTGGFSGDGGPATSAKFQYPQSSCIDASGNLYIGDYYGRVRMLNSSGIITTYAGNGGYDGDGGAATAALLQNPTDVCSDNAGNVFIADYGTQVVRKVTPAGVISTLAGTGVAGNTGDGGSAVAALLNKPMGVGADKAGNIYIADQAENRVRRVDGTTGVITSYAGNGSAGFSGDGSSAIAAQLRGPIGIAIDTNGNLYISDNANNRIRKVDATTHNISTYAGTGTAGFSGDSGPASAAKLSNPQYIALNKAGDLFIADKGNNVIRKVDGATGIITTVFGNGTSGSGGDGGLGTLAELCDPIGVAVDDSEGISTTSCGKIRHIPPSGGPVTIVAGNGQIGMTPAGTSALAAVFNGASGLTYDISGRLLVAETENRVVRVKGGASSGVKEVVTAGNGFCLYPNPGTGVFEITGSVDARDAGEPVTLTVINVLGQVVYSTPLHVANGFAGGEVTLPADLAGGVYYCHIAGKATHQSVSFLLQR